MRRWTFLLGMMVAACGDDGGSNPVDAPMGDPDGGVADAAAPDAEDRGDDNDDFSEAEPVTLGDQTGVLDAIAAPDDKDYYVFTTTAPGWVIAFVEANPMDDPAKLDAVLSLYDANETRLAENDDAVPRVNTDPEIITYLPEAGTYYLEVQEYGTWSNGIPEFGDNYLYTLRVLPLADVAAANLEPAADPGDTVADAVTAALPAVLAGFFNTATDVDVYAVDVTAGQILDVAAMPDGTDGYGSTSDIGDLWVTDPTGTTILARVNAADGPFEGPFQVTPSLPAGGPVLIWIERSAASPAGANDYWVAKAFGGQENPREAETAAGLTNDSVGTAEPVAMTAGAGFTQGFVLTELSTATDVDYHAVTIPANNVLNVFCSSARNGSGVQGLTVSVRRADDSVVSTATESLTSGAAIMGANLGAAGGTAYVRFSKTGQSAEVAGTFVRCGFVAFDPP